MHRLMVTAALLTLHSAAFAQVARAGSHEFLATRAGEAVATIRASCRGCDWGRPGAEAVALRVGLDGRYSQHLVMARGGEDAEYSIVLGPVEAGIHELRVERDERLSARRAGKATIASIAVTIVGGRSDEALAVSLAPILYARPDTLGRFTDLPLLAYYEVHPAAGGREFRFTVIFTNEDGGTPADRLMATWGRTTDIEFVYGVRTDAAGTVVAEEIQAPGHAVVPFTGRHEGRHPLLWVATDNNMVDVRGTTSVRYAPSPGRAVLDGRSREAVMDAHAWTYAAMIRELARERKIEPGAAPGSGRIPDVHAFVFVETCAAISNAALALSAGLDDGAGGTEWYDVDRGVAEFRVSRTGCTRVAVPVPRPAARVNAIRVRAFESSKPDGTPSTAELQAVTRVFVLDGRDEPSSRPCAWRGSRRLEIGGAWEVVPCG